jgi:hypothetical protein
VGAAVAFFYAGFLSIQWQLLIVVTFLFIGILGFFAVLFNDATNGIATLNSIQENDNEDIKYQNSVTSSFAE